ncbi:TIGR02647 family protein [Marinobacter daqiaonensis]|uniref:TIGR02647 family protein n=1 Tax=Marinobacter daqiaonensis TaxID=650891 RepID=A0A1I6GSL4_9GAMM|nr:TIGR02647 family protein [Marinobacter daqiaonensis]SFR45160.1 TIGR02647 family protein [Marinobacter daqiaonensis]
MPFSADHIAELNLLTLFDAPSSQEGIKVHEHSAAPEMVAAAERLHAKGLISQRDGGYLTNLGSEAAEHAQRILYVLTSDQN